MFVFILTGDRQSCKPQHSHVVIEVAGDNLFKMINKLNIQNNNLVWKFIKSKACLHRNSFDIYIIKVMGVRRNKYRGAMLS